MAFQKSGSKFSPRSSSHGSGHAGTKSFTRSESRPETRSRHFSEKGPRSFAGKPQNELSDAVCEKCGRDCKVPFRPQNGKPVYCSDCFSKNDTPRNKHFSFEAAAPTPAAASGVTAEDIRLINKKLDQIMRALEIN